MAKQTTIDLHKAIKADYNRLFDTKENGVRKYSHEFVISTVAKKYFKADRTIENIVFNRISKK